MRRLILSIVAIVLAGGSLGAQPQEHLLTIAVRGTYTTSSKIFDNPDSPSADLRGEYVGIDNIYSPGFEIRVNLPGTSIALTLAAEYLSKSSDQTQFVSITAPPRLLPVKEGYILVPIEVGGHTFIPLGSERVRLTMGGGVGAYLGKRILTIADADAAQQNKPVYYGIHVETSFDYQLLPGIFARAEMRFRDPEITTESQFTRQDIQYNGVQIALPRERFRAKINVNGLTFGLGIAFDIL